MIRPSVGSTRTLPGCGSPWKNPSTRICLIVARMKSEPRAVVSSPAAAIASAFEILIPLTNSIVRTRGADSSSTTSGMWMLGNRVMPSARRRAW